MDLVIKILSENSTELINCLGLEIQTQTNLVPSLIEIFSVNLWRQSNLDAITQLLGKGQSNKAWVAHFGLQNSQ